jgi:hypothetical protein
LVARVPFCLVSRADFAARSFLLLILLPPIKGIVCGPVLFLVIVFVITDCTDVCRCISVLFFSRWIKMLRVFSSVHCALVWFSRFRTSNVR